MSGSGPPIPARDRLVMSVSVEAFTSIPAVPADWLGETNSSSIVSKRSVERLYYTSEPHFFRFFVPKFQRRAPLINRGYHLRLRAVDFVLRRFLERPGPVKAVVNLGCGSDVLPWQCLSRYPERCRGVKFVDVDFPDLMLAKRDIVTSTPELTAPLTSLEVFDCPNRSSPILLCSDQYCQIGCDLRDLPALQDALSTIVNSSDAQLLFIAEVSITYMDTHAADSLIQWASSLGSADFCLLEQIIPDGSEHPFASTMIAHFDKLNTPLKSIQIYPTLEAQASRFLVRGWTSVSTQTLWHAWADNDIMGRAERQRLDDIEPFDEWEDLALFASHYCLLHARNINGADHPGFMANTPTPRPSLPSGQIHLNFGQYSSNRNHRRFGASFVITNVLGQEFMANFMGTGTRNRLQSCDLHRESGVPAIVNLPTGGGPATRMCHTVTDLGHSSLLVGGRTSPEKPMRDCWIFGKDTNGWLRTYDLPFPLYRHAIARLGDSSLAMLVGGKTGPWAVSDGYLVYHPEKGWLECTVFGAVRPAPVFGAILASTGNKTPGCTTFGGVLAGGMLQDGTVPDQILNWQLDLSNVEAPVISFATCSSPRNTNQGDGKSSFLLNRFGASCLQIGDHLMILGGIVKGHLLQQRYDILTCRPSDSGWELVSCLADPSIIEGHRVPRPLMVGSSVAASANGDVVLMGGGTTCFSMGTFWTKGVYSFPLGLSTPLDIEAPPPPQQLDQLRLKGRTWEYWQTFDIIQEPEKRRYINTSSEPHVTPIPSLLLESKGQFERVMQDRKPVVLKGVNIGPCTSKWDPDYILDRVGRDRLVVVHESSTSSMDFRRKNFRYVTKKFGQFIHEIRDGKKLYLRALSNDTPASAPAMLVDDFPCLSADFSLPIELSPVTDNIFSSVLRVSGPVNMWLHYDVMANVYCQAFGSKRFVLFPPIDVGHLGFPAGASSSSVDVFSASDSLAVHHTHAHEAVLQPGDILFIPPLWSHAAAPTSPVSIAVNVFFRDLESGYSSGRDVYGNRDLASYEKGRQDVERIASAFKNLPPDARSFYLQRLAEELLQKV